MVIKELTNEEFRFFTEKFNVKSIYQTVEYGIMMNHQNYDSIFLGLVDDVGNILGASLILIKNVSKFKYAYAPRGFLIDYNNSVLFETFTKEIKKYLGKKNVVAINVSPLFIKDVYDFKYNTIKHNNYFNKVFKNFENLGYHHCGFNNFFENFKPRFEAFVDLSLPYYILFKNIDKKFRTKIRSAEDKGVKVYLGKEDDLDILYSQTKKKYSKDLNYFKDCYNLFKKNNRVEFFYTKLDTELFLKHVNKEFHKQEEICNEFNFLLSKNNSEKNINKLMNKKLDADKLLDIYKKDLIRATSLLKNNPDGIITSSILIIKNGDEVFNLIDGYDPKFKDLNSKHLLVWKLCERYSNIGYKKFNLNGITNPNFENNKFKGLNEFKIKFNSIVNEYIGDFELVTNNTLYFMYKNIQIKKILKK